MTMSTSEIRPDATPVAQTEVSAFDVTVKGLFSMPADKDEKQWNCKKRKEIFLPAPPV